MQALLDDLAWNDPGGYRIKYEQVLSKCGVEVTLMDHYERALLRWFGHIERVDDTHIKKHK